MWWLGIAAVVVAVWFGVSWAFMAVVFWNVEHSRDGFCACKKFALSGRKAVVTATTEHSEHRCSPLREVVR